MKTVLHRSPFTVALMASAIALMTFVAGSVSPAQATDKTIIDGGRACQVIEEDAVEDELFGGSTRILCCGLSFQIQNRVGAFYFATMGIRA
jgi:hypothetical protein